MSGEAGLPEVGHHINEGANFMLAGGYDREGRKGHRLDVGVDGGVYLTEMAMEELAQRVAAKVLTHLPGRWPE